MYPFEVGCWLDLSYRLHESISDNDRNICARVSIRLLAKGHKIWLGEAVGSWAQMEFEHEATGMLLRQGNVDPLLKSDRVNGGEQSQHKKTPLPDPFTEGQNLPSPDSWVQGPWDICSPEHQHSLVVIPDTCESKCTWVNLHLSHLKTWSSDAKIFFLIFLKCY